VTFEEYAAAWSRLHGGFDPRRSSAAVRGWVLTAYRIGSWLGRRRIGPAAVTAAGVVLGLAVPFAVPLGRFGLLLGALLVLLGAAADSLDGAVAVVTGRTSRLGYVYDSVADRLARRAGPPASGRRARRAGWRWRRAGRVGCTSTSERARPPPG